MAASRMANTCPTVAVCFLAAGLMGSLTEAASAVMLTFTYEGTGSGTLHGVPFAESDFTITGLGDTDDRRSIGSGWAITHTSTSIHISGLGNFVFLSGTATFVNNNNHTIGLGRFPEGGDLFNGPNIATLGTWDMLGPIGPISGQGYLMQWSKDPQINTTEGILIFNNGSCATTFTATSESTSSNPPPASTSGDSSSNSPPQSTSGNGSSNSLSTSTSGAGSSNSSSASTPEDSSSDSQPAGSSVGLCGAGGVLMMSLTLLGLIGLRVGSLCFVNIFYLQK